MEENMAHVYAFLAPGLEEVECLAVVDVLKRSGVDVTLVSIADQREVTGAHDITIVADTLFSEADCTQADLLFLPGGMPGTRHLAEHKGLEEALKAAWRDGRRLAAICAAPSVLGRYGFLEGKTATCYPGFESQLTGASHTLQGVVTDGMVTTARGLGYALDLGLELAGLLTDKETAAQVKAAIQYDQI